MSKSKEKGPRYGGLAAIRQAVAEVPSAVPPVPEPPQDDKPEPFSSHLTATTKRRLKQASAKEGRKQFETLEQAVNEYLDARHPDIQ
jgi:uncharacterized protein YkwD